MVMSLDPGSRSLPARLLASAMGYQVSGFGTFAKFCCSDTGAAPASTLEVSTSKSTSTRIGTALTK